ncbi:MAG: malto-oligosyltrehalose trehalohydrolase [Bacteroidetes bacterium]|nr:MAG: malto-oligosyltrehalose trehalohydrolase [Bacteroidota bacterium]
MSRSDRFPLGALPTDAGVLFRVWAPRAERVDVVLTETDAVYPMDAIGRGYFERTVPGIGAGTRYKFRLDGDAVYPDPASRYQPEGVHGPSMVVDPSAYAWQDAGWTGRPLQELVFYELYVGTFSPEGTFAGVRERLPYLRDLGVTAVELMPVADFPGRWNWGYDHAALYAPSRAYGTPDDLRALVDEAHRLGMAVFLDVIYNHLGPDGAYAAAYGPFFTSKHRTPWGDAINLDDEGSEGVRHFFLDNALHWLREYHVDGFRLDATHALFDDSPTHFLAELSAAVAALDEGPRRWLIAEDHRNLNTLVRPRSEGGYGLDGVWVDDVHHLLRNMTAGDTEGYYADFRDATAAQLAKALNQGWYYDGQRSPTSGRPRGTDATPVRHEQCVVFIQNHDQVGNRPLGDRLHHRIPLPVYRAASATILLAPELPLLFMGQEWAASTPFLFFSDHAPELGRLVTEGRKKEFDAFSGFQGDVPDPQDPATFERSRLRWEERAQPPHAGMHRLYRDLLRLRRDLPADAEAHAHGPRGLTLRRGPYLIAIALADDLRLPWPAGAELVWHSEQPEYAEAPRPPVIEGATIHFPVAGAAVARTEQPG